jgi:two-component system LytT family response regulator
MEASRTRIKTLIVDDEPLARRGLELRLASHPDVEIVGQCGDGAAALDAIARLEPDLVFLDVQMPGVDGLELLRAIPASKMPLIVFVTAFDHYAISAFEASAVDYLLKPVEESRLHQAMFRVREAREQQEAQGHCAKLLNLLGELSGRPALTLEEALDAEVARDLQREDKLAIRDGNRLVRLEMGSIRWVDAAGDYMCIHADSETYVLRATMRELEKQLDPQRFPRVHRSTIVNVARVKEMRPHTNGEYFLTLDCGHELKLSRSYRDKLELLQ